MLFTPMLLICVVALHQCEIVASEPLQVYKTEQQCVEVAHEAASLLFNVLKENNVDAEIGYTCQQLRDT